MSRVDELKAWYIEAIARRDGSWAPDDLVRAAADELIDAARIRGVELHESEARYALKQEVDAVISAELRSCEEAATGALSTLSTKASRAVGRRRRSPGRPSGSMTVPKDQLIDVFRQLKKNFGRPPTQAELVVNLKPAIEVRTLQAHLTAYSLPWPIE